MANLIIKKPTSLLTDLFCQILQELFRDCFFEAVLGICIHILDYEWPQIVPASSSELLVLETTVLGPLGTAWK